MKNIADFFSYTDIPIGLKEFRTAKIVSLRLIDLKSDTPPKYSIYYQADLKKQ